MKAKCFNVEVISYTDKDGKSRTIYKVWFSLTTGVGWLMTSKACQAGDELLLEIYPIGSQDVKTNMRLGIRIV